MSQELEHRIDDLEKEAKELALAGVGAASLLKDRAEKLTKELARRGEQVLEARSVENTPLHRHNTNVSTENEDSEKTQKDGQKGESQS